jgi:tRNA pseudouridine32 synthase / 23S rRNA pseudouridine746 synthase
MRLPLELHLKAERDCRAQDLLQHSAELSADIIHSCFDNGSVWLQKSAKPVRIRDWKTVLTTGQQIHLYCNQSTLAPCPYVPVLIKDFETFSIWNKPSGMLSQGSKWGDHWALYRWIEQHVWSQRQSFITHRLDRFTQGLMIVAHSEECNSLLHRMFENRQVEKTYRAIVRGMIEDKQPFDIASDVQNKKAVTNISLISHNAQSNCSVIEAKPQTGRKHQIRIHLASIGHPVLNDRQYGAEPHAGDLRLQASALQFTHPYTRQKLQINLPEKELFSAN